MAKLKPFPNEKTETAAGGHDGPTALDAGLDYCPNVGHRHAGTRRLWGHLVKPAVPSSDATFFDRRLQFNTVVVCGSKSVIDPVGDAVDEGRRTLCTWRIGS
jgi:hypothetical protein